MMEISKEEKAVVYLIFISLIMAVPVLGYLLISGGSYCISDFYMWAKLTFLYLLTALIVMGVQTVVYVVITED